MTNKLCKAINLIEEAGGIVMMSQDFNEESESRDDYLARLEMKEQEEKEQLFKWQEQRKESLNDMADDFDSMLGSKNFSVTAVENMVHSHGLDMDDLEDLIHNFY